MNMGVDKARQHGQSTQVNYSLIPQVNASAAQPFARVFELVDVDDETRCGRDRNEPVLDELARV